MRRKVEVDLLRKIAGIRQLQLAAAEAAMVRANLALSEKNEVLRAKETEREAIEQNWKDALSAPFLPLEIMPLWAEAVVRRDGMVRHAANVADNAALVRDLCVAEWRIAEQRGNVADDMALRARNEHLRKLEEDALLDSADRHLQHWRKV